jgi:hypothetical protein
LVAEGVRVVMYRCLSFLPDGEAQMRAGGTYPRLFLYFGLVMSQD